MCGDASVCSVWNTSVFLAMEREEIAWLTVCLTQVESRFHLLAISALTNDPCSFSLC